MPGTIFALSSGRPPAGIAVIRISGPAAFETALAIAGKLPPARTATLRSFRDPSTGELLDRGLLIVAPAPNTATGENVVEFQCHGGKATIDAMLRCLQQFPDCRIAEAGEFTRRALVNGRLDLTEAEGLGDLLTAETELQRKVALGRSEGSVRRAVERIRDELLALSATVELAIDYADEEDGEGIQVPADAFSVIERAMGALLDQPPIDRLRDGVRVVVAGPPNAGKSSLVNALAREDRAIVTPIAGTTRDAIEVPLAIDGIPVVLVDTAGLRDAGDEVEEIGIRLAQKEITCADLVLWLGEEADAPDGALLIASKADLAPGRPGIAFSAFTERGHREVLEAIAGRAQELVPSGKGIALSLREREMIDVARREVGQARANGDLEIQAHFLRRALEEIDRITGHAGVEDMLDSLFSRFCVGK